MVPKTQHSHGCLFQMGASHSPTLGTVRHTRMRQSCNHACREAETDVVESLAYWFASLRPTAAGYLSMHHPADASQEALVSQGESDDLSVLQLIDAQCPFACPFRLFAASRPCLYGDAASLPSVAVQIRSPLYSSTPFRAGNCPQVSSFELNHSQTALCHLQREFGRDAFFTLGGGPVL